VDDPIDILQRRSRCFRITYIANDQLDGRIEGWLNPTVHLLLERVEHDDVVPARHET
jgi:hypothetical protein